MAYPYNLRLYLIMITVSTGFFLLRLKGMGVYNAEYSLGIRNETYPVNWSLHGDEYLKMKRILLFTSFLKWSDWGFGLGREPFITNNCSRSTCTIMNNPHEVKSFNEFDAIMFHMKDIKPSGILLPNQKQRRTDQIYIMHTLESPNNIQFPPDFLNVFNWTMTYRDDSDIPMPYGYIVHKDTSLENIPKWNENEWLQYNETTFKTRLAGQPKSFLDLAKKPKLVAWIVSNCATSSERESYVKQLEKHIPVDIFGACSKNESVQCEKQRMSSLTDTCSQVVEKEYKFYLSFENSICDQYVTEKFFLRMTHMAVPIVMGGGPYQQMAPPRSFIDVADFASPKELATYLWYLDKYKEEYLSYFWWKEYYQVNIHTRGPAFCHLCAQLHNPIESQRKYLDISYWWHKINNCKPKGSFPWSR